MQRRGVGVIWHGPPTQSHWLGSTRTPTPPGAADGRRDAAVIGEAHDGSDHRVAVTTSEGQSDLATLPGMDLTPGEVDAFVAEHYPDAARSGIRCESLGPGSAVARWTHDPATLRPGGLISGPTQFAVSDVALWYLSFTVLGLAPMAVTSDLSITFLRPAAGGDLLARAELLRAGRTRITGRVDVWVEGSEDRLVSHAAGSYAVLDLRADGT